MISIIINSDTRHGYQNDSSTVGDFGEGSLQGVRSIDFLLAGVKNKMDFFRGHKCQCVVYIDQHNPLPEGLFMQIAELVHSYGNNSRVICRPHNRTRHRWYDYITIEALKWAEGDYIVHFDNDANAIKTDDSDIVQKYFHWLDNGYKYVCQPSAVENHGMYWASTRFFICKSSTLNLSLIENNLHETINGKHTPCFEHIIGVLAGDGTVLYPSREDDKYLIWSWARYYKGTLDRLNNMEPKAALEYVLNLGVCGPNDVLDKPYIND